MGCKKQSPWQWVALTLASAELLASCGGSHSGGGASGSYTVSVDVSGLAGANVVLQNNSGDDLTVTSSGTTPFSTALSTGAAYAVTVKTQPSSPTQVCIVAAGSGNIAFANVTVSVDCVTSGGFAYVPNGGSGSLSEYVINKSTGALVPLTGSPVTVAGSKQLYEAKVDPTGAFLYAVDNGANAIFGFSISQSNGSLTPIANSPFTTGKGPVSLAFDSTGSFLYVANYTDSTLSAFSLATSTGELVPLITPTYTVTGNAQPSQIVNAGSHLYVADHATNSIDVFTITAGTGALAEGIAGSPFATDTQPYAITVDPTGAVLYTANAAASGNGSISAFTINSTTGTLSPVAGNPQSIPVSWYISIDPQSKFLFVTESTGVAVYPITLATGVLGTVAAGSPFAAGTHPYSIGVDPSAQFVYVGNDGSANVSEFTLNDSTGVLTTVVGSPAAAGNFPDFIAIN